VALLRYTNLNDACLDSKGGAREESRGGSQSEGRTGEGQFHQLILYWTYDAGTPHDTIFVQIEAKGGAREESCRRSPSESRTGEGQLPGFILTQQTISA
jgi:hypothetical protein